MVSVAGVDGASPFEMFSKAGSECLTRGVYGDLNYGLKGVGVVRFTSNRFTISCRRSVENTRIFLIRSAFPGSSGLVRLLLVVSTTGETSTGDVMTIVPCFK